MADSPDIPALLTRIRGGAESDDDYDRLRDLIGQGRIVGVEGAGGVGVGGGMSGGSISTFGAATVVLQGADTAMVQALLARRSPPRRWQLPRSPNDFVDRMEEIRELLEAVSAGDATMVAIVSAHGPEGVGKTTLAVKLAARLADSYPDGQLFVELHGSARLPRSARSAQRYVIQSLEPDVIIPADHEDDQLTSLYRSTLAGRRTILLLDDAAGPDQVEPLIPPADNVLLITSRRPFMLDGLRLKRLERLPPPEAIELLSNIVSNIGSEAEAIVELCDHLPQAIRWAGNTMLVVTTHTPREYMELLREARQALDAVRATARLKQTLCGEFNS
jgi:hypothetical protein